MLCNNPKLSFLILTCVLVCGCDKIQKTDSDIENLFKKIEYHEKLISDLNNEVKSLRLSNAINEQRISDIAAEDSPASINPSDNFFGIAKTKYGAVAISCSNIEKYGSGLKINLLFGNTTNVTFSHTSISMVYGKRFDENEGFENWRKGLHKKKITVHENLFAGSWNKINISLPDVTPDYFEYFEISVRPESILLIAR